MLSSILVAAGEPCAACHSQEAARHAASSHARALLPAAESPFARALPEGRPLGEARGGFLFSYERIAGTTALAVTAERGNEAARARIDWIFGAGGQGTTPVAVDAEGRAIEHRISFYPQAGRFDLTLGHQPGASRSAAAALGVVQPAATLRDCLGCHATLNGEGEVVKAGVDCERCHTGAAEHKAVANPAKLSAAAQVELCAACHRLTPPPGVNPRDPLLIRFQPLRLVKSKCYATGQLRCGSCHAAHENTGAATRVQARAQCLQCHAQPHRPQEDCVACHMPRSSPAPYLNFTDHWITIQSRIRP